MPLFGCSDDTSTTRELEVAELIEYALSLAVVPKGAEPFHGVSRLLPFKLQKAREYFSQGQLTSAQA